MSDRLRTLLQPLNLAALLTMSAVGLSLRWVPREAAATAWLLLLAFAAMFLACSWTSAPHRGTRMRRSWLVHGLLALLPLPSLALVWLHPRIGTVQVLLVIWTAVIATTWAPPVALGSVLLVNSVMYLVLREAGHPAALVIVLMYSGFQAFAALTAHYAVSAERTRDQLARVNADLLATRALLADSTRNAERLRVARELHDVAGHKLTALALNLRLLEGTATAARRPELEVARQLAGELMHDLRGVVAAMRGSDGLDLATALHALAAPLPRPALQLEIGADARVDDAAVAETILRTVQEALTNAARHADAGVLRVSLQRAGTRLRLAIDDDGHVRAPVREGNGLAGMRERITAAGGTLGLSIAAGGGLRIDAELPA